VIFQSLESDPRETVEIAVTLTVRTFAVDHI
jgi:hypothetical protein